MQTAHDPTITSYYVTDELYRELLANFTNWQREELAIAAPEARLTRTPRCMAAIRAGGCISPASC